MNLSTNVSRPFQEESPSSHRSRSLVSSAPRFLAVSVCRLLIRSLINLVPISIGPVNVGRVLVGVEIDPVWFVLNLH